MKNKFKFLLLFLAFLGSVHSDEVVRFGKEGNYTVEDEVIDLDEDGKIETRLSIARKGGIKVMTTTVNVEEKTSFTMIYRNKKVHSILADLDGDSFFEYLALLNDLEEIEVVFKRDRKGGLMQAPEHVAKQIWPF